MASWQKNPENFKPCTREEAAAQFRTVYFTGKPCKHGHTAPRYVTTGGCLACLTRHHVMRARNPFSHDLVPYLPSAPLWRSKRLTPDQLLQLDRYMQECATAFCAHVLPPICKVCDGTRLAINPTTKGWEVCEACAVPEPSTADSVPTGTAAG